MSVLGGKLMSNITESELKSNIKSGNISNIYILLGEEKLLIKYYTGKLIDKILGKNYLEFNYQVFCGTGTEIDDIADAVNTLPLMAHSKCVKVVDLDIDSMSSQDMDKLNQMMSDVPETTKLILTYPTLEIDLKKSSKWKKFIASTEKVADILDLQKLNKSALEKQLVSWTQKYNCTLSLNNAAKIVELCGNDLLTLRNEIEKLCAFTDGNEITSDIIDTVVTKNLETTVFALSDAIIANNYNKAYKQLNLLFYQKEEPVAILAVLSSAYIDMYRVRAAIERKESASIVSKYFDYKNKDFRIRNAERNVRNISIEYLRECINILAQTDLELKSSRTDNKILLQKMIAKLCALRGMIN